MEKTIESFKVMMLKDFQSRVNNFDFLNPKKINDLMDKEFVPYASLDVLLEVAKFMHELCAATIAMKSVIEITKREGVIICPQKCMEDFLTNSTMLDGVLIPMETIHSAYLKAKKVSPFAKNYKKVEDELKSIFSKVK